MTLETGVKALAEAVAVDVKALEDGKVDKVTGKGLSTEAYTSLEKTKLAGIQAGAQVNAVTSVSGRTGAVTLAKGDVGLSNVDNTSDINKPISTAASSALSGKVDKVSGKGLSDTNYTQAEKTKLVGIASEATKNRADSENADKVHMHPVNQVTGLGTAATANLTTSSTDGTAGRVLRVGDFGVGGNNPRDNSFDANDLLPGQRRSWSESFTEADAVSVNLPALGGNPTSPRSWHVESMGSESSRTVQYATEAFGNGTVRGRTFVRVRHDTTWHPWREILVEGSHGIGERGNPSNPASSGLAYNDYLGGNTLGINSTGPYVSFLVMQEHGVHIGSNKDGVAWSANIWHSANQLELGTTAATARDALELTGEWVDLRPHLKPGFYWDPTREGKNSYPRIRKLSCGRVELDGIVSFNETSDPLPVGVFVNVPSEFRPPLTTGGLMFGDTASPLSFGACNWIAIGQVEYSPPGVHGDISVIPLTLTSPAQGGALSINGIYWFT